MNSSAYRQPQFWVGIFVSVACLAAIFLFIDPVEIFDALKSADLGQLVIGIFFLCVYMVLRAVRWAFMLENKVPTRTVFHIQNIGYMLTQLLPLRLGDPARAVLIGNVPPLNIGQGISTMVVERILDLLVVVTILPFALSTVPTAPEWIQDGARVSGILALLGTGVVIVAANFRPKFQQLFTAIFNKIPFLDTETWVDRLDSLLAGLVTLTNFKSGSTLIALSIAPWIPIIWAYQYFMFSVSLDPTFMNAAFVVCAGAFSIAAPSSPGQVGVFHAGVIAAITFLGMDSAAAASFAFVYHAINFTFIVLLGILGLSRTQSTFGAVIESTRTFIGQRNKQPVA